MHVLLYYSPVSPTPVQVNDKIRSNQQLGITYYSVMVEEYAITSKTSIINFSYSCSSKRSQLFGTTMVELSTLSDFMRFSIPFTKGTPVLSPSGKKIYIWSSNEWLTSNIGVNETHTVDWRYSLKFEQKRAKHLVIRLDLYAIWQNQYYI